MEKIVHAEEHLLDYLKDLTSTTPSAIGVLIGQSTKAVDYVVHMTSIKNITKKSSEPYIFNSVKDIKRLSVKNHVDLVKQRLPGGLTTLGIFICSATEIFNDLSLVHQLKILANCTKTSKDSRSLTCDHFDLRRYIFHYNPINQKYTCKFVVMDLKPAEWKFQKNCTQWCQISCKFCFNFLTIVNKKKRTLEMDIKSFLQRVRKALFHSVVMVGNKVLDCDQDFQSIITAKGKKKIVNGNEIQCLEATFYTPFTQDMVVKKPSLLKGRKIILIDPNNCIKENIEAEPARTNVFNSRFMVEGTVKSDSFVCKDATIKDVITAIQLDILESLSNRIDYHSFFMKQEPEEKFSIDAVHPLPRRVSILLPNSPFFLFEYVFPEEDDIFVTNMFKSMFDAEVTQKDVNMDYESTADLTKFHSSAREKLDSTHSDDMLSSTLPTGFLIAALSFAVILIAIAVALRMHGSSSLEGETA